MFANKTNPPPMLSNPMFQMIIKTQLPAIKKQLVTGEEALKKYLDEIELNEGETHAAAFTDIHDGTLYIVVGAFNRKTFVRAIQAKPMVEWLTSLITKAENDVNA